MGHFGWRGTEVRETCAGYGSIARTVGRHRVRGGLIEG